MMHRLLKEGESINVGDEIYIDGWEIVEKSDIDIIVNKFTRPIIRDMDKWIDGVPPIGARVEITWKQGAYIVVGINENKSIFCCQLDFQTAFLPNTLCVQISDLKPWEEK